MTLIAVIAAFMIGSAGAASAGSLINGKKIKSGSIPYSALSKDAQKKLKGKTGPQGPQGAAGAGVTKYWAMISQSGSVLRSSGGVTATWGDNGGTNPQYRVTFPADISACGYFGSTADPDQFSQAQAVQATDVSVARSTLDARTLAVTVTLGDYSNTNHMSTYLNDNFFIAVVC
ncbi:MAG: hypothetical protein QM648_04690 [Solirubrobacterales bacterium]